MRPSGKCGLIYGNRGDDVLYGNLDRDTLYGGADNDTVFGGSDNDIVFGNIGADSLVGGIGNDLLHGGQGTDTVQGGDGADTINGGVNDDLLSGGGGADVFELSTSNGHDTIADFSHGVDIIRLARNLNNSGIGDAATLIATRTSSDGAGHAVIDLGDSHQVTLLGVARSTLTAADFAFI